MEKKSIPQLVKVIFMGDNDLLQELFHPGSIIKMEYTAEKDATKIYETKVEDLESEYLVLQSPVEDGKPVLIDEGRELTLWCEKKIDNQAYVTNVFVVENRPGEIPLLVCCKPQQIEKASLRRYSRFKVDLPCSCSLKKEVLEGRVVDISRSGCSVEFASSRQFSEGDILDLEIEIPGGSKLAFSGEVVRVLDAVPPGKNKIALEIKEMTAEMDEELKNYLFQCQLMT